MFKLNCIKCKGEYESEVEDAYLCLSCFERKKEIAKKVDLAFSNKLKKEVKPLFTEKDFVGNKGCLFFNAKDLGF